MPGQLDNGFMLEEGESQHQFFLGLDALLFYHLHESWYQTNIFAIPFYYGGVSNGENSGLVGSPIMLLPMITLGYIAKWHVTDIFEISFNSVMASPSPGEIIILYLITTNSEKFVKYEGYYFPYYGFSSFYGPAVSIGIGFRRNLKNEGDKAISYKFNLNLEYSPDFHGVINLKNSFLFGFKKEKSIVSYNPFITSGLKVGFLTIPVGVWIVVEPGFELASTVISKKNFAFSYNFMIGYEMNFIVSRVGNFYYIGKLIITSSFGIGVKTKSKKKACCLVVTNLSI